VVVVMNVVIVVVRVDEVVVDVGVTLSPVVGSATQETATTSSTAVAGRNLIERQLCHI
jgi:hypothetical protein